LQYKEQVTWAAGDPGGTYTAVKAFDINFKPALSVHVPAYQKPQGCRGPDDGIVGGEGGVLSFKTYMRGGNGSESLFSVLASNCGLDRDAFADDASVVVSGTVDNVVAPDADAGIYGIGDGIMVGSGSTDVQIRFVSGETAGPPNTTLVIEPSWTAILTASDNFYALDTFKPHEDNLGEPTKYMAFKVVEGGGTTNKHQYILTGCACSSLKIVVAGPNTLPVVEWEYQVDDWAPSETALTDTADAFAAASPTLGDAFYVDNTATYIRSFTFDLGLKLQEYTATSGTHGRQGWIYTGGEPKFEGEFYWDEAWHDKWIAGTTYQFLFESIKSGTTDEGWAIYIPSVQVLDSGPEAVGDLKGNKPEFLITDPGYNGDATPVLIPLWGIAVTGSGS
jgi:hypothetical protein